MTLPRELLLVTPHTGVPAQAHELLLASRVVPELAALRRGPPHELAPQRFGAESNASTELPGARGVQRFELRLTLRALTGWAGVELANAAGELYRLSLDGAAKELVSDRSLSRDAQSPFCCDEARGVECGCFLRAARAPLPSAPRTPRAHEVHLFVDTTSVEVFVDGGRLVLSDVLMPTRPFERARLVGRGFTLSGGTLYDLGSGMPPERACAKEALRAARHAKLPTTEHEKLKQSTATEL